jgi:hypothetical protein
MYMAYRSNGPGTVIYFISLVLIGRMVVLSLFLAILLGNF